MNLLSGLSKRLDQLEKEDCVSNSISYDIPHIEQHEKIQTSSSAILEESPENSQYGMPINFSPEQTMPRQPQLPTTAQAVRPVHETVQTGFLVASHGQSETMHRVPLNYIPHATQSVPHVATMHQEFKLADLTSVRQQENESVCDYIKRFKEIRNRCYDVSISDKDLVDIATDGLRSIVKEKLEGFELRSINQVLVQALGAELKINKDVF